MNKISLKRNLLVLAISAAVVTGCGGGSTVTSTGTGSSSIGGGAAKGIISGGIIKAYPLDATGTASTTAVGSATTEADGTYSLKVDDTYDGTSSLLLELTADNSTTMICDALNGCGAGIVRGSSFTPPANFKLRAIIPPVTAGSSVNAQLTPYTDMAAAIIQDGGDASATKVQEATSRINQIVGVNILEVQPVDITKPASTAAATEEEQRYALMLAALANEAFEGGTATPEQMLTNLENFSTDMEDGVMGDDQGGLSPQDLVTSLNNELNDDDNKSNLDDGALAQAQQTSAVLSSLTDQGTLTPGTGSGENTDKISQAKALLTQTRSWISSIDALEKPADAFGSDAETINQTIDNNSQAVLEVFAHVMEASFEAIASAIQNEQAVPTSVDIAANNETLGQATITDNSTTGTKSYSIAATNIAGVTSNFTFLLNNDLSSQTISAGDLEITVSGDASNAQSKFTLASTKLTLSLGSDINLGGGEDDSGNQQEMPAVVAQEPAPNSESSEPDVTGIALAGGITIEKMSEGSATGDKLEGNADIELVKMTTKGGSTANDANLSLKKLAFTDLKVSTSAGSSVGLSMSLNIDNATSFDTFALLESQPVLHFNIDEDSGINFDPSAAAAQMGITSIESACYGYQCGYKFLQYKDSPSLTMNDDLMSVRGPSTCVSGTADSANFAISSFEQHIYDCVSGTNEDLENQIAALYPQPYVENIEIGRINYYNPGYVYPNTPTTAAQSPQISGYGTVYLDDIENVEHALDATLNVTGKINLTGNPEAVASLTIDKTGFETGEVTLTIAYNGQSFQLNYDNTGKIGEGDITITNPDGVKLVFSSNESSENGAVYVNEDQIGTIEKSDSGVIVRFNDGSFVSL